jgi:hypothetical protein
VTLASLFLFVVRLVCVQTSGKNVEIVLAIPASTERKMSVGLCNAFSAERCFLSEPSLIPFPMFLVRLCPTPKKNAKMVNSTSGTFGRHGQGWTVTQTTDVVPRKNKANTHTTTHLITHFLQPPRISIRRPLTILLPIRQSFVERVCHPNSPHNPTRIRFVGLRKFYSVAHIKYD